MRLLKTVPLPPAHAVDLWVDGAEGELVLRKVSPPVELLRVPFAATTEALRAALGAVLRVAERQGVGRVDGARLEALQRRLEAVRARAHEEFPDRGFDWESYRDLPSVADLVLAGAPAPEELASVADPEAAVSFAERRLEAARRGIDLDRVPRHAAMAPPGNFKAFLRSGRR